MRSAHLVHRRRHASRNALKRRNCHRGLLLASSNGYLGYCEVLLEQFVRPTHLAHACRRVPVERMSSSSGGGGGGGGDSSETTCRLGAAVTSAPRKAVAASLLAICVARASTIRYDSVWEVARTVTRTSTLPDDRT
eukprot:2632281-Pleurochrysis_carterae.AAC.1